MPHTTAWFTRLAACALGMIMVLSALLAGPAPIALADRPEATLFRAEFDSAPLGPLSSPLTVAPGTVVPQAGNVAITSGKTGRALKLASGAGETGALLQWSNYPGALPVNSQGTLTLR